MISNLEFRVAEIFHSIQGESSLAGRPCVFVRFQGCNMRCTYCDTDYARRHDGGIDMSGAEIFEKVKSYGCDFVEFTGGEPTLQKDFSELLTDFCGEFKIVAVETNGSTDLSGLDARAKKIIDVKCPDSGSERYNYYDNLRVLTERDEIKFVISSRRDYEFTKKIIAKYDLKEKPLEILLSPARNLIEPKELSELILKDKLKVRLQLQLHKIIFGDVEGV